MKFGQACSRASKSPGVASGGANQLPPQHLPQHPPANIPHRRRVPANEKLERRLVALADKALHQFGVAQAGGMVPSGDFEHVVQELA